MTVPHQPGQNDPGPPVGALNGLAEHAPRFIATAIGASRPG